MRYVIVLEGSASKQITVEARSYSDAIKEVQRANFQELVELRPTWIGEEDEVNQDDTLRYEYLGDCHDCKIAITTVEDKSIPWNYRYDDGIGYTCYHCVLRKGMEGVE